MPERRMTPARPDPFATVAAGDFGAMIDAARYGARSPTFDRLISETHLHSWDPGDPRYIRFDEPFDMTADTILPVALVPELGSAVADRLTEAQKIAFANETARWWLSGILHGEQAALSLSASLCQLLRDPGAVEYAANQAREEARHVTAFSRYIASRWGEPFAATPALATLLGRLVSETELHTKVVGMQLLVEGLAMGLFSTLHRHCRDATLKRLTQLVMVDEAFHHEAGKIWAGYALPAMTAAERDAVEDWALSCFQVLISNLQHPLQKQAVYRQFGLEWTWVRDAMREAYASKERRSQLRESNRLFDVLIGTLFRAGIVTRRTRHYYAVWADLDAVDRDQPEPADDQAVREGIDFVVRVNSAGRAGRKTGSPRP